MRKMMKSQLFIALSAAFLCLLLEATQAVDHVYWNVRYKFFAHPAPTEMMLVSLDSGQPASPSLPSASTRQQAQLVDKLVAGGAQHIFLDFPYVTGNDPVGDQELYHAIARAGDRLTMVNRAKTNRRTGRSDLTSPDFKVPQGTRLAGSAWYVNVFGYAIGSPPTIGWGATSAPAVATIGAITTLTGGSVIPDFSVDPGSIPVVNAQTLLTGESGQQSVRGRNAFVTSTNQNIGSAVGYFGNGWVPSAKLDIASIEGAAQPAVPIGGMPILAVFCCMITLAQKSKPGRRKLATYAAVVAAVVLLPIALAELHFVADIGVTAFAASIYGPMRLWTKWRQRVQMTSSDSGLPNVDALASRGVRPGQDVVAASVGQYEQMLASLPQELHGECARQIARRLSLASSDAEIYDAGGGHFVWINEPCGDEALIAHFEGLKALLAAPVLVAGHVLDTNVHFGVDRNGEIPVISRIRSAMASSTEAQGNGKLYAEFGQQRMAEASWELSLHARIDEGLKNGDIWVAYQPKLDLRLNRVTGAEALIRWNDPVRGPIPPDAFILQAERAGRIDTITYWVMEQAITASRELERQYGPVQISVNLSAWMADQPSLIRNVADIIRATRFDCRKMTFEVTETFSMVNRDMAKKNLSALRAMGFPLSIDDFGTGQAGLAYLSEIPSDEIKLDKRFIQAILTNPRDRTIVASVIDLAHALGQKVVAEGVEDLPTLNALRDMGCDIAQGYHIARPTRLDELLLSLLLPQDSARMHG